MAEKVLLTQERCGLRYKIVEMDGARKVKVRIVCDDGEEIEHSEFTPDQCDALTAFGSLARARENVLAKLQEKINAFDASVDAMAASLNA